MHLPLYDCYMVIKKSVLIEASLWKAMKKEAKARGMLLSAFISKVFREAVEAAKP